MGNRIRVVLDEKGHSARWLAEQIPCERTNVYNIFGRTDINVRLLGRISQVLEHDFFKEISADLKLNPDDWKS
jgi:hypothetical protein